MFTHAAAKFPLRHPPPSGLIEKTLAGCGSLLRALGAGLDGLGASIQGPGGIRETGGVPFYSLDLV